MCIPLYRCTYFIRMYIPLFEYLHNVCVDVSSMYLHSLKYVKIEHLKPISVWLKSFRPRCFWNFSYFLQSLKDKMIVDKNKPTNHSPTQPGKKVKTRMKVNSLLITVGSTTRTLLKSKRDLLSFIFTILFTIHNFYETVEVRSLKWSTKSERKINPKHCRVLYT